MRTQHQDVRVTGTGIACILMHGARMPGLSLNCHHQCPLDVELPAACPSKLPLRRSGAGGVCRGGGRGQAKVQHA